LVLLWIAGTCSQVSQSVEPVGTHRLVLSEPLDLFIAATGSDAGNNCTARDLPCISAPACYRFVQQHVDLAGLTVTVHVLSNFTLVSGWTFSGPLVGAAGPDSFVVGGRSDELPLPTIRLMGSPDPDPPPTVGLFFAANGATFTLSNIRLASPLANGYTVLVGDGAVHVANLTFVENRCSLDVAGGRSSITQTGPLTWSSANFTFGSVAEDHGQIFLPGSLVMEGVPRFGVFPTEGAFVQADLGGMIDASGAVVVGRATGRRYTASMNGIVFTGGTGNQSFFPGDIPGSQGEGGLYQ
jgi:hypothetical protein